MTPKKAVQKVDEFNPRVSNNQRQLLSNSFLNISLEIMRTSLQKSNLDQTNGFFKRTSRSSKNIIP